MKIVGSARNLTTDIKEEVKKESPLEEKYRDFLNTDMSSIKLSDSVPKEERENMAVKTEVTEIPAAEPIEQPEPAAPPMPEETTVFADEYFEIVGQVFNTYIIAEKGDEMMIIDQHAAHERLKYEELKREVESKSAVSQMLIEPVVVNLSGEEFSAYLDNEETFAEMGFECEEFGDDSIIVRAVPQDVEYGETELLLKELIFQAKNLKKELISEKKECIMYSVACKTAIKANRKLSTEEMKTLVRNVLRLHNINTCPHGRPIIVTMSKKELEKEFKRIV